jgi:hypothetical protein
MKIKELNSRLNSITDDKSNKIYTQFVELLNELRKRELSENIVKQINLCIDKINSSTPEEKHLTKFINKSKL